MMNTHRLRIPICMAPYDENSHHTIGSYTVINVGRFRPVVLCDRHAHEDLTRLLRYIPERATLTDEQWMELETSAWPWIAPAHILRSVGNTLGPFTMTQWVRTYPDEWPYTPPLTIFRKIIAASADPNIMWRIDHGHLINIVEEAMEELNLQNRIQT